MCKECNVCYPATYESRIELDNPTMEDLIKIHEQELIKLKRLRDLGAHYVLREEGDECCDICCDAFYYRYDVLEPAAAAEFGLREYDLECHEFIRVQLNRPRVCHATLSNGKGWFVRILWRLPSVRQVWVLR